MLLKRVGRAQEVDVARRKVKIINYEATNEAEYGLCHARFECGRPLNPAAVCELTETVPCVVVTKNNLSNIILLHRNTFKAWVGSCLLTSASK